ncbi:hypothetical protein MTO96_014466 [Rhipicephalus appendiculatus]
MRNLHWDRKVALCACGPEREQPRAHDLCADEGGTSAQVWPDTRRCTAKPGIAGHLKDKLSKGLEERSDHSLMSTGAATIRPLAQALSLLLSLTLLHLTLLPSKRVSAEAGQYGQQRRQSFLVTQICMGSQSFTNTINLVLTFGRSVLAQPRPLSFGGNLGLNVTLRGLDTLSLRGTAETYCDDNVAEALIPVRLSPTIVVTLISPVPYLPYVQKDIAGTLSGLEANVGIRVDRNDPNGRLVISSLQGVECGHHRRRAQLFRVLRRHAVHVVLSTARHDEEDCAARARGASRVAGLAKHICKGTQKFTNTINLLLTFGKKVLEDPRPLKIGEQLGLNVTINGLDTLQLRGTPQTFCNESVAEAVLPLRLSPSVVLHRRRSILFGESNSDKNVSYTLAGLEMDVGVRVNRNDPDRHVEITSLDIVYVDVIEIEVKTFAPISGRPVTLFLERPPTAVKLAMLRPIIQSGLQRMIDSGGFKLSS